jgi:hypothetical protein
MEDRIATANHGNSVVQQKSKHGFPPLIFLSLLISLVLLIFLIAAFGAALGSPLRVELVCSGDLGFVLPRRVVGLLRVGIRLPIVPGKRPRRSQGPQPDREQCFRYMGDAIEILRRGDLQCRIRAACFSELLFTWI